MQQPPYTLSIGDRPPANNNRPFVCQPDQFTDQSDIDKPTAALAFGAIVASIPPLVAGGVFAALPVMGVALFGYGVLVAAHYQELQSRKISPVPSWLKWGVKKLTDTVTTVIPNLTSPQGRNTAAKKLMYAGVATTIAIPLMLVFGQPLAAQVTASALLAGAGALLIGKYLHPGSANTA